MDTVVFAEALLPTGWMRDVRVAIDDGRIASVEPGVAAAPGERRAAIGLPGLANLHSHAFQRGLAGLAERSGPDTDSFWTWREVMYRFLERLTPEDVASLGAQAFVEMLEGGFTRVGEFHYLHHAPDGRAYDAPAEMACAIAAAAAETGIGLTLLPCFYAHGGFDGRPASAAQRRFVNDLDGFGKLLDGCRDAVAGLRGGRLGVAPHSLRAVSAAELRELAALAPDAPLHIHVAEQVREVEECLAWTGQRPVAWLLDHAGPDERWCLIHATHMTPKETVRLAATAATVGWCPITEANLGDGTFGGAAWMQAGGRWGVGTDSNILIGAAAELRQAEYSQRLAGRSRNVMVPAPGASTGRSLFDRALAGGARACGVAHGLQVGAPADMIALDADDVALSARAGDLLLDGWVFASRGRVEAVWVGGDLVVSNGRHRAREAVARRFAATLNRVLA